MRRPFYVQLANMYDLARIAISTAPQNPISPHKKWHLGIQFMVSPDLRAAKNLRSSLLQLFENVKTKWTLT
jgi:hypothetical protein